MPDVTFMACKLSSSIQSTRNMTVQVPEGSVHDTVPADSGIEWCEL